MEQKNIGELLKRADKKDDFYLPLCDYSHDYDGAVYKEDICSCGICIKDGAYCLKQDYKEKQDYETVSDTTDYIPVTDEEMKLGKAEFCKLHCKNEWAFTYNIFERIK